MEPTITALLERIPVMKPTIPVIFANKDNIHNGNADMKDDLARRTVTRLRRVERKIQLQRMTRKQKKHNPYQ